MILWIGWHECNCNCKCITTSLFIFMCCTPPSTVSFILLLLLLLLLWWLWKSPKKKTVERTWHAMKPRLICLRKCTFLWNSRLYSVAVVFFLFSCKYQTRWDLAIPFEKMSCMFLAFANWILGFRRVFFCCYCCECRGSDSQFVRCDWECAHAVIHKIQSGTFDGHRCQFM